MRRIDPYELNAADMINESSLAAPMLARHRVFYGARPWHRRPDPEPRPPPRGKLTPKGFASMDFQERSR